MTDTSVPLFGHLAPAGWDGASYAANTAHHRVYDDAFLAATPIGPTSQGARPRLRQRRLQRHARRHRAPTARSSVSTRSRRCSPRPAPGPARTSPSSSVRCRPSPTLLPSPEHDASFDLVLSRSVLHWVPAADQPGVYADAARLLRPGGWVRVECGGGGNVAAVQALLDDVSASLGGPTAPWTFADAATAMRLGRVGRPRPRGRRPGLRPHRRPAPALRRGTRSSAGCAARCTWPTRPAFPPTPTPSSAGGRVRLAELRAPTAPTTSTGSASTCSPSARAESA